MFKKISESFFSDPVHYTHHESLSWCWWGLCIRCLATLSWLGWWWYPQWKKQRKREILLEVDAERPLGSLPLISAASTVLPANNDFFHCLLGWTESPFHCWCSSSSSGGKSLGPRSYLWCSSYVLRVFCNRRWFLVGDECWLVWAKGGLSNFKLHLTWLYRILISLESRASTITWLSLGLGNLF